MLKRILSKTAGLTSALVLAAGLFAGCSDALELTDGASGSVGERAAEATGSKIFAYVDEIDETADRVQFKLNNVDIQKGDVISFCVHYNNYESMPPVTSLFVRDGSAGTKWSSEIKFDDIKINGDWYNISGITASTSTASLGFTFNGKNFKKDDIVVIKEIKVVRGSSTKTLSFSASDWARWSQPKAMTFKLDKKLVKVSTESGTDWEQTGKFQFMINRPLEQNDVVSFFYYPCAGAKTITLRGVSTSAKWVDAAEIKEKNNWNYIEFKSTAHESAVGVTLYISKNTPDLAVYIKDFKINGQRYNELSAAEYSRSPAVIKSGIVYSVGSNYTEDTTTVTPPDNNSSKIKFSASGLKDSNELIFNPDMGFYSALDISVTPDGIRSGVYDENKKLTGYRYCSYFTEQIKKTSNPLKSTVYPDRGISSLTFDLIHLKFDIADFSDRVNPGKDDYNLTPEAVNEIQAVFDAVRAKGKTCIPRFCYDKDYQEHYDTEPTKLQTILDHIDDICKIYKKNADVITAIECGMIGPWGEMHSSDYADSYEYEKDKFIPDYYIAEVINAYLVGLDKTDIPLLVRQPKFIYAYLNKYHEKTYSFHINKSKDKNRNNKIRKEAIPDSIPEFKFDAGSAEYRLGLYNDGYLGSESDSGTFKYSDRDAEIKFLEPYTNHTPYGGELIGNYGLLNGGKNDYTNFKNVHLSFLNIGWNSDVLRGFNSNVSNGESIFSYLYKHMGYRYYISDASFTDAGNGTAKMDLTFKNNGFANLPYHRIKRVKLYLVPTDTKPTGNESSIYLSGTKIFTGQSSISVQADLSSLNAGSYDAYIKIVNDSDGKYPIQLANPDWSDNLKAVKIGTLKYTK